MKRNKLIAIAVGAIMGAALSAAYADQPPAPGSDNPQANQQATSVNPAPFGSGAAGTDQQTGGQQPASQPKGPNTAAGGQGSQSASGQTASGQPAAKAPTNSGQAGYEGRPA